MSGRANASGGAPRYSTVLFRGRRASVPASARSSVFFFFFFSFAIESDNSGTAEPKKQTVSWGRRSSWEDTAVVQQILREGRILLVVTGILLVLLLNQVFARTSLTVNCNVANNHAGCDCRTREHACNSKYRDENTRGEKKIRWKIGKLEKAKSRYCHVSVLVRLCVIKISRVLWRRKRM